jgi:ankyrin repeat protein
MGYSLREVIDQVFQPDSTVAFVEEMVREHPELINAAGRTWSPGFHSDRINLEVVRFLVERGAPLSIHAAAGFGFVDAMKSLLDADPDLVRAKGGDGCTALHFARNVTTARFLLERGAEIDARDEDHDSTPAQWRIGSAPEVSRLLLEQGARADIFLAAALGDQPLAERLIGENPACVAYRIGRLTEFPPIGHRGRGGSILQWTLAFNSYSHQIALLKGHPEMFHLLERNSDPQTRLLVYCTLARREEALAIASQYPGLVAGLPTLDLELLPRYCWETNLNYEAVRLMLDVGFPIAQTESSHGYSPLHNAAWAGNAALVDLLLSRGHPVDMVDPRYKSTALGYAFHDCLVEKRHPEGDFPQVIELLLKAGSPWDRTNYPTGNEQVDRVLSRYL